ncbi:MAG: NUDIX domain-containing protein [Cyanobacteriota bacterium]
MNMQERPRRRYRFFSVRVYGIWLKDKKSVMISDEYVGKKFLTKFPGGGVEFGEGSIEALKREWREEVNIEIDVKEHFYTTDFFQASVFNPNIQIVSIYYFVEPAKGSKIIFKDKRFDFDVIKDGAQVFRVVDLKTTKEEEITLPIDRKVFSLLKKYKPK